MIRSVSGNSWKVLGGTVSVVDPADQGAVLVWEIIIFISMSVSYIMFLLILLSF
jgi:hypothetical protein